METVRLKIGNPSVMYMDEATRRWRRGPIRRNEEKKMKIKMKMKMKKNYKNRSTK